MTNDVKPKMQAVCADVIIVGYGLTAGLLAYRFKQKFPLLKVQIYAEEHSSHSTRSWLFSKEEVSAHSWFSECKKEMGEFEFDSFRIDLPSGTKSFSKSLSYLRETDFWNAVVKKTGPSRVDFKAKVKSITSQMVILDTGETKRAPLVIDARERNLILTPETTEQFGWVKGLRTEVKLEKPHNLKEPVLFDFKLPQLDGCRFITLLPLTEETISISETFLSSNSEINEGRITRSLTAYLQLKGLRPEGFTQVEQWRFPLELSQTHPTYTIPDFPSATDEDFVTDTPVNLSAQTGFYNLSTGRVLPEAVRLAEFISSQEHLRTAPVRKRVQSLWHSWECHQPHYRTLNRLFLKVAEPQLRYQLFESFFKSTEEIIFKTAAGLLSPRERSKLLALRPPLSSRLVAKYLSEKSFNSLHLADA